MNCLTDKKIHDIAEHSSVEYDKKGKNAHIENCKDCSKKFEQYKLLDENLDSGLLMEPPVSIAKFVMSKILAKNPSFQSVILSILFSISTIVFLIFTYYGFAKDSLLKGVIATGNFALNGLQSIILALSALLDYSIVFVKTINKLTKIILGVGADAELIGLLFVVIFTGIFFTFHKLVSRVKLSKGI